MEDLIEENVTASAGIGGVNGILLVGTGVVSYILTCTLVLFMLIEYWNSNKHQLKKWWRDYVLRSGDRVETTPGTGEEKEQVGGVDQIPGPRPLGKILGNCMQLLPVHETLNKLLGFCNQYGEAVKIFGNNETVVILNSPETIHAMCKSTSYDHVVKAPVVYDLMKPFITNGVLVSKGKFWQNERKILLRSMSFQSLRAYIPMLNTHCKRFVNNLEKLFVDRQVHTINEEINAAFLEVICEMITGFDINGTDEGVEYHHNFQKWKEQISYRLMHPWFFPNILWRLNPMAWETDKAIEGLFAFARRRIALHREKKAEAEATKKQNHVSSDNNDSDPDESGAKKDGKLFRSVLDELVDAGVSDDQIVDEVNTMLFGGHETGASTIHFFCFAMALYPDIQEQCRREIDDVFDDPMQSANGKLSYEAVGSLKYVERCMLETLRLYPPVWAFLRQIQAPLRIQLKGKPVDVPVGTNVCICPYFLHRTEKYYPNATHFDPDRFLPEECANRHAYSYIPFSAGPRNCLGLKFGMIEMKIMAAYILRNFIVKTTDKLEDVKLLAHLTLTPERDYNFIFEKRKIESS